MVTLPPWRILKRSQRSQSNRHTKACTAGHIITQLEQFCAGQESERAKLQNCAVHKRNMYSSPPDVKL